MIDLSKKYKTTSDESVKLYAIEGGRVIGAIQCEDGRWRAEDWDASNGNYYYDGEPSGDTDLIEVKEKKTLTGFVNIYSSHTSTIHKSIIDAERVQLDGIIARKQITIEYEEGEGL
jgi:hypothetical protein